MPGRTYGLARLPTRFTLRRGRLRPPPADFPHARRRVLAVERVEHGPRVLLVLELLRRAPPAARKLHRVDLPAPVAEDRTGPPVAPAARHRARQPRIPDSRSWPISLRHRLSLSYVCTSDDIAQMKQARAAFCYITTELPMVAESSPASIDGFWGCAGSQKGTGAGSSVTPALAGLVDTMRGTDPTTYTSTCRTLAMSRMIESRSTDRTPRSTWESHDSERPMSPASAAWLNPLRSLAQSSATTICRYALADRSRNHKPIISHSNLLQ
jgi:hypothetical protein